MDLDFLSSDESPTNSIIKDHDQNNIAANNPSPDEYTISTTNGTISLFEPTRIINELNKKKTYCLFHKFIWNTRNLDTILNG